METDAGLKPVDPAEEALAGQVAGAVEGALKGLVGQVDLGARENVLVPNDPQDKRRKFWSEQPTLEGFADITEGSEPTLDDLLAMRPGSKGKSLHEEICEVNDALYVISRVKYFKQATGGRGALLANLPNVAPKMWGRWEALCRHAQKDLRVKALNTDESALFPAGFSSTLVDAAFAPHLLPGLVPNIQIPRSPFRWPVSHVLDDDARRMGGNKSDTGLAGPTTNEQFGYTEFTTAYVGQRVVIEFEAEEDAIIAAMPEVSKQLARSLVFALEDMVLNGDVSATHMDTAITSPLSAAKCARGWRKYADTYNLEDDDLVSTKFTPASLGAMMSRLGAAYQADLSEVLFVMPPVFQWTLNTSADWSAFQTANTATAALAAISNGFVPTLYGMPLVKSAKMATTMDASGRNTGQGTKVSALAAVNKNAWALARQGTPILEIVRDPETLQYRMVIAARVGLNCWRAGDAHTVVSYNVPTLANNA